MNRKITQEQLAKKILEFGRQASEHLQISKRLRDLLPDRMKKVDVGLGILTDDSSQGANDAFSSSSSSKFRRGILVSDAYLGHVDELIEIRARGLEARIQYETHVMLYEGRKTLESLHRAHKFRSKTDR